MKDLPQTMIDEINALEGFDARALHRRYREYLSDMANCQISGILRSVIAYRMQERFYGVSLNEATKAKLEGRGDLPARLRPLEREVMPGARLFREWKGERHEVIIREDGKYEYKGKMYRSLSGVARAITGTQWNGKLFFGVK